MSLTGLRSRTSNVELLIRSHQTSVAKFLSRSQDAYIALIGNCSNTNSNIGYIGNDADNNELYISQSLDNKMIGFGLSNIKVYADPIYHTDLLPMSSNYDINEFEKAYLTSHQLLLNNAMFSYNNNTTSFINNTNNAYLEINTKLMRIEDQHTGYYSILSTGTTGAILSTYSSNNILVNTINIGKANTSIFAETSNHLYYTEERVRKALEGSNIDMTPTSNALTGDLRRTSNQIVVSLAVAKAGLSNYVIDNSDTISQDLLSVKTRLDTGLAHYLTQASNTTLHKLSDTSNQFLAFVQTDDMFQNILHYINNTSNQSFSNIDNHSNIISQLLNSINDSLGQAVNHSSNILTGQLDTIYNSKVTDIDTRHSNLLEYLNNTSNTVMSNVTHSSNHLYTIIVDANIDSSNCLLSTSNLTLGHLLQTSNTFYDNIVHTNLYPNIYGNITTTSNVITGTINESSDTLNLNITSLSTDQGVPTTAISSNQYIVSNTYVGDLTTCNLTLLGDIIPSSNLAFDLGAPDKKWKDVYVTGNSIYIGDTIIGADPETNGFSVKNNENVLTQLVTTQIKILDNSGNYIALQSENNDIVLTAYTPSGDIDTNVSQEKTTDDISEMSGASNLYYTPERAAIIINASNILASNYTSNINDILNSRITNLSADQVMLGAQYEFITSNVYLKDLLVNAKVTASNLNVIGTSTRIKTFKYETENVGIEREDNLVGPAIKVTQKGTQNVADFEGAALDLVFKNDGKIGSGTATPAEKLEVSSNILFSGTINTLSSNHLSYITALKSTLATQLSTLRIQTSSNFLSTSNQIHSNLLNVVSTINSRIISSDTGTSNYLLTTSNYYESNLKQTSNNLIPSIQLLNSNMSNYIRNTSNTLSSNLTLTSNTISTRITDLNRDMSNYLDRTSNTFATNSLLTSNTLSSIVNNIITTGWTASNSILYFNNNIGINNNSPTERLDVTGSFRFTRNLNTTTSNQIHYLKGVTANVQTQINNLNTFSSNYISFSSNAINSNIVRSSNILAQRIRTLDNNMSNYVQSTSNILRTSCINTSNQIDTRIKSSTLRTLWSNMTGTISSNIFITSNIIIGSNVTNTLNTSNRLNVFKGDINIRGGNAKKMTLGSGVSSSSGSGPVVWYQFDQDPTVTNTLNDSNVLGTKYDLSIINIINNIRKYPPAALEGTNVLDSTTSKTLSGQAYGNGTYLISWSSDYGNWKPSHWFDGVNSGAPGGHFAFQKYNNDGTYKNTETQNIVSGYNGEWVKLTLPNAIYLSYVKIYQRAGFENRSPIDYKIYGTNNTVWTELISVSNATYSSYVHTSSSAISQATAYKTFGLVLSKIGLNPLDNTANFDELEFYGNESATFILSKTTGYTANLYLYRNAYSWNGNTAVSTDNAWLQYNGGANNIQALLNTFHNNNGFSIHFVFKTTSTTAISQILFIGNTTGPTDIIRVFVSTDTLGFKVGGYLRISNSYIADRFYIVDLTCSISGGNMEMGMSVYDTTSRTYMNLPSPVSVAYNNILSPVLPTDLVYWIGKSATDATNDATPVTLQDFRMFPYAMTTAQITNIQTGSATYDSVHPTITVNGVNQTATWISGNDYYYAFTNTSVTNTITFSQATVCDVLLVGGGGGGSANHGGGGGGGAVVFMKTVVMPSGTFTINVGNGGVGSSVTVPASGTDVNSVAAQGNKGGDSKITLNSTTILLAEGGGAGGASYTTGDGGTGGSGGGADGYTATTLTNNAGGGAVGNTSIDSYNGTVGIKYGNIGGNRNTVTDAGAGGGGGGAGTAGSTSSSPYVGASGGNGIYLATIGGMNYEFSSLFGTGYGTNNDANNNRYFSGGGGGAYWYRTPIGTYSTSTTPASGGKGGGGKGGYNNGTTGLVAESGLNNTGGGGGGGDGSGNNRNGGAGGSGIVIIRYTGPATATITTTSNYQFQRWNDRSSYYTQSPKFITYTDGSVGIRTNNPSANMHVGAGTSSVTSNMVYFNSTIRPTSNNYNLQNICATFDSSILVTGTIASSSDQRIKTNINDINDDSALQKMLSVQPKTYKYIDPNRGTSSNIYGFIAQQIGTVIPEAITTQIDTIPNIYAYADCTGSTIAFSNDVSVASNEYLKVYANVDIINYDTTNKIEKYDTYTITSTDPVANSITINKPIYSFNHTARTVFVYGTRVNDFHTLNKSYIYTLNVCATQTLADKINQLKSKLSALEKPL
jgi:hypothetical protein